MSEDVCLPYNHPTRNGAAVTLKNKQQYVRDDDGWKCSKVNAVDR